jgi:L-Ala-D/L-Glu epimerase
MKITDIKVYGVSIPLIKPFKTALRVVEVLDTNIIEIGTDSGDIGFGEASPTAVITGDTKGSIREAIEEYIFPAIKGMDIEEIENIMLKINKSMIKNTSPKAAVDMAVYDLFGKHFKIPLYKFFGGAKKEFETDITISINGPEEMAADALQYVRSGYDTLKLKVGIDSKLDILRVKAIRESIGPGIKIRLDANQGWSAKEAVRVIRKMEDLNFDIELVEQPVPYYDIEGLKYVTDNVEIPIMADEALFTPRDAVTLLADRCVDILNIKLMKAGGLYNAQKICSIAEACGVECMIGSMMESRVGITAAAHFTAGKMNITKADLDASTLLKENPVVGGVQIMNKKIIMGEGYGLGISKVEV